MVAFDTLHYMFMMKLVPQRDPPPPEIGQGLSVALLMCPAAVGPNSKSQKHADNLPQTLNPKP